MIVDFAGTKFRLEKVSPTYSRLVPVDDPDWLLRRITMPKPIVHFVGFRDERWWNAVKVFGRPDFIHRYWDARAVCEVMEGDVVVFADGNETQPVFKYTYDDSAHF